MLLPIKTTEKKKKSKLFNYLKYPEADIILNETNRRFKKGLGTNIFVIGLSGTGKSSTSQRLGELINESRDNKFEVYIVDSLLNFVKAVRNSKEGDSIVIEEVSVLFPSRRAMAKENVAVGSIFDTVRKKRLCIISNAPIWGSIDSHMRALGHIIIETLVIKKSMKIVISKFHRLQTNPKSGKTYTHTFQRNGRDIRIMYTKMPNKEKWDEYEKQKEEFMDKIYKKLQHIQEAKDKKELKVGTRVMRKLTKREIEVHDLVNVKKMNNSQAAGALGITPTRIGAIIKNIHKKLKITKEN